MESNELVVMKTNIIWVISSDINLSIFKLSALESPLVEQHQEVLTFSN